MLSTDIAIMRKMLLAQVGPRTSGNIYFVIKSTDAFYAELLSKLNVKYADGTSAVHTTVASAYAATTSGRNDVIAIFPGTHSATAMISVTKNLVHFVGVDLRNAMGYGARAKLSMGVTTAATDLGVLQNTGIGNSFENIKFMSSNTKAESLYSVVEAGEYAVYRNCELYKDTDLDQTGAAELVQNGDSALFERCTIGSSANETVGAIVRANVLLTRGIVAGKVSRDSSFVDCILWRKSGHADNRFVYGANANDVERLLLFKGCTFYNNRLAAADPAQAIAFGAAQTEGDVVVDPTCMAVNVTKVSTTTGVMVGGAAVNAGAGIAVNAA